MTATEITRTGYFYKTTLIDRSSRPTGRMPWTVLRLWGFLCVRDAGRRGNKITATYSSSGRGTETLSFQKIKAYALILTRQQFWKKSHLAWANKHAWVALMEALFPCRPSDKGITCNLFYNIATKQVEWGLDVARFYHQESLVLQQIRLLLVAKVAESGE